MVRGAHGIAPCLNQPHSNKGTRKRGDVDMAFSFSQRSKDRMEGLHPDIVAVMGLAIERSPIDFTVLEGLRTVERQKQLVARGASKTMNSRHLTGHAIDVAPFVDGEVTWDWPFYHQLAPIIKQAASDLGVDLEWGGDWQTFKDGPHWQLSWNTYGKEDMEPRARYAGTPVAPSPAPAPTPPTVIAPSQVAAPERVSPMLESTTIAAQFKQWVASIAPMGVAVWSGLQQQDPITKGVILGGVVLAGLYILHLGRHIILERLRKWHKGDR